MRTISGGFNQQWTIITNPEYSIFEPSTPGELDYETASIVVGTKFRVNDNTSEKLLSAIRWYRTEGFPGVSEVAVWDSGEFLFNSATVTGETSDGWQTMVLDLFTSITTNDIYTLSALYPNGGHRFQANLLDAAYVNGPLEAVSNTTSSNGVYALSSTMVCPTTSAAGTCFFIDAVLAAL